MEFQPGPGRWYWRIYAVMFVILLMLLSKPTRAQGVVITVQAGEDLQQIANAAPAGATIYVQAGLYRLTNRINPKDNQTYIAQGLVTLRGSKPVTNWDRSGQYWVSRGQTQENPPKVVPGQVVCESSAPRCNYRETLFYNRVPLEHVDALNKVAPGKWFFDYPGDAIYVYDDPTGVAVETSIAAAAFASNHDNVTLDGFNVEMFANPLENGAVEAYAGGHGWRVLNNVIVLNSGVGAVVRQGGSMLNNTLSFNGQAGYGAGSDSSTVTAHGVVICGNRIEGNNTWKRVHPNFSAGAGKVVRTTDAIICDNVSIANRGTGFWTDLDNVRTKYHRNTAKKNTERGIFHEWGYGASIIGNTLECNGLVGDHFGNANIVLTNVSDVQVMSNQITVCERGNGIVVRKDGGRDLPTTDIDVCHNTIIYQGAAGQTGADAFLGGELGRVLFCDNTHYSDGAQHWRLNDRSMSFADWLRLYPSEYWLPLSALATATPTLIDNGGGTPEPIPKTPTAPATQTPEPTATPVLWWIFEIKGWPGGE